MGRPLARASLKTVHRPSVKPVLLSADQGQKFLARLGLSLNEPSIALVTVCELSFSTPRITMHRCRAFDHHAHAQRSNFLLDGVGDLIRQALLNLQRRANMFTSRGIFDRPTTFLSGI